MKIASLLLLVLTSPVFPQTNDHATANRIFSYAFEHRLMEKPIGEVIVTIGKRFIGAPYEAGSLDRADSESLVIDLHSFDCVTFVENILAIARCVKKNRLSFDSYQEDLEHIRYRNGVISGYVSRLHYFSEWIRDNEKKGIVKDVTRELGGIPFPKKLNFMTKHRSAYPKLANDSSYRSLKDIEAQLEKQTVFSITKGRIEHIESKIHSGDIIAITARNEGLDVNHTGIAVRLANGTLHLLHAPDIGEKIRMTIETLSEYVRKHSNQTGVIVIRVLEP